MNARSVGPRQLAVIVLFALSCFGLLLYLWLSFGGASPLAPKGYRFQVDFPQASQLGEQADVRISGVPVGRVAQVGPGPGNSTRATIELDARFAPARRDMRALLRTKTLLGEAYVELTPGRPSAPPIPEGGTLGADRVQPAVALDEILRALTPRTRAAFGTWMESMAAGYRGRQRDISNALGVLPPFTEDTGTLAAVLHEQSADVERVVHDTGIVFAALSRRRDQLQQLIRGGDATFGAIGRSNRALARAFALLPGFERSVQQTLPRLDAFAAKAGPALTALGPAVAEMTPTFRAAARGAPALDGALGGLRALTRVSVRGVPALVAVLGGLRTLFAALPPPLRNLEPILGWLGRYVPDVQAFVGNVTAASQVSEKPPVGAPRGIPLLHEFRAEAMVNQLALAGQPARPGAARANAYGRPGTGDVPGRQHVFSTAGCGRGNPVVTSAPASAPEAQLVQLLTDLGVTRQGTAGASATVAAPQCDPQGPFTVDGRTSAYPHLLPAPELR